MKYYFTHNRRFRVGFYAVLKIVQYRVWLKPDCVLNSRLQFYYLIKALKQAELYRRAQQQLIIAGFA